MTPHCFYFCVSFNGDLVDVLRINIQQQCKTLIHSEMSAIEVLSNKYFT